MPLPTIANQGETLDAICWRVLGATAGGVVEQALELNPGIAATALIGEGTAILLPDPPLAGAVGTLATTNLWD
ncbi:tail protein X [Novosphingobium sp.]|uniref:tail protein X n=1 Tax=Novosphingobium sp. TaxID=1874826 RepID=UPI002FDCA11F